MKRKLLILASTFFLAGCGAGGTKLEVGQKYTLSPTIALSAKEEDKSSFFSMIHEMKDVGSMPDENPIYEVVDAFSLGQYFASEYKSLNITYHLNEPKDFFTFKWENSTTNMIGGLNADGSFCDVYANGTFYEDHPVQRSTQTVRCSVTNHFLKLSDSDIKVEMTASIEDFDISSGTYSDRSKSTINVTIPVTK